MNYYSVMITGGSEVNMVEADTYCGSLFPYITTKVKAFKYVRDLKKRFPNIQFGLFTGKTWGELELVKNF